MVRKQLYLEEAQDKALKMRAKELGISEAEVVRRALNESLLGARARNIGATRALESFLKCADEISRSSTPQSGHQFDRQSLYEEDERFKRWTKPE